MENFSVALPANWSEFLKDLPDEHDIDVGKVISGLCDWAFSSLFIIKYSLRFGWIRLIHPKVKLKTKRVLKAKKQASLKNKTKRTLKRKPTKIENTVKTKN